MRESDDKKVGELKKKKSNKGHIMIIGDFNGHIQEMLKKKDLRKNDKRFSQ